MYFFSISTEDHVLYDEPMKLSKIVIPILFSSSVLLIVNMMLTTLLVMSTDGGDNTLAYSGNNFVIIPTFVAHILSVSIVVYRFKKQQYHKINWWLLIPHVVFVLGFVLWVLNS